jgi:hypothetical protein
MAEKGGSEFRYDSWELDSPQDRPLIQDFLEYAQWFLFSSVKDRKIFFLTLKETPSRFLGTMGYYQKFIHMFMVKTHPLL